LLVLYGCFAFTTVVTASALSYGWLLAARAIAGAFGGVLAATVQAIIADAIPEGRRGHAFGVVASAFSIASIAGIPLSIYLAAHWSWRTPFFFSTALCLAILAVAYRVVPRVRAHIEAARERSVLAQARALVARRNHLNAFGLTVLLNFSGFCVVPFIAPYLVANVGIGEAALAVTYFCGGLAGLVFVRFVGRLTDLHGRRRIFAIVAGASVVSIFITTHLPAVALWVAALSQALLICTFSGRYVPALAIVTAAVTPQLRGSFMSLNAALQQLAAGVASFVAAAIIATGATGELLHFGAVGWLSIAATVASILLAMRIHAARE
jgi:predicted MFS family arabinose efflux permease